MIHIRGRDFAELFCALGIERQTNFPTFVAIAGARSRNMVAAEVGFLFHEQPLLSRLFIFFRRHFINFDPVIRRNDFLAFINRSQAVAVVRKNHAKFQLRYAGKLFPRLLDFRRIQARDLHQNPIV